MGLDERRQRRQAMEKNRVELEGARGVGDGKKGDWEMKIMCIGGEHI